MCLTYNQNYCEFLGINKEKAIGKHVTEVIEITRMHIVAKTGIEKIAGIQYIQGNYKVANRVPLLSGGENVGARSVVGMVFF
ncbi:hypothetical protein [Virgibacillus kimchii]